MSVDNNPANSATSLAVEWRQTDADAATAASYKLYRRSISATSDGNNMCTTDGTADLTTSAVNYKTAGDSSTPLRIASLSLCAGAAPSLGAGR